MTDKPASLLTALLAVQSEVGTLTKDKTGAHGAKYTPLDTIVEQVGPVLAANGLVWTTLPESDAKGDPVLRYRLMHADTGMELEGVMPLMLSKHDAQGLGSAITYARRYAMCAVLNLVADDDDDGQKASQAQGRPRQTATMPQKQRLKRDLHRLREEGMKAPALQAVLDKLGIKVGIGEGMIDALNSREASALIDALADTMPDPDAGSDIPTDDLPWNGEVEPA